MKTWIFTEDTMKAQLEQWVQRQKATEHPKAVANADFVAQAIQDFLQSSPKLWKDSATPEIEPQRHTPPVARTVPSDTPQAAPAPKAPLTQPAQPAPRQTNPMPLESFRAILRSGDW